eukprot:1643380-Pleurochrysis_carterae.AAC.3
MISGGLAASPFEATAVWSKGEFAPEAAVPSRDGEQCISIASSPEIAHKMRLECELHAIEIRVSLRRLGDVNYIDDSRRECCAETANATY